MCVAQDDDRGLRLTATRHRRARMNDKTMPRHIARPTSMTKPDSALCHLRKPAQVRGMLPGRDACHGTISAV
jgi:hypothetical protein